MCPWVARANITGEAKLGENVDLLNLNGKSETAMHNTREKAKKGANPRKAREKKAKEWIIIPA